MVTTEIATVPLKPGSNIGEPSNPAAVALKDVGDTLSQQDGFKQFYFGTQVESPDTVQLFVDWDKIDDHIAFTKSETYKPFLKNVVSVAAGPPSIHHVDFKPDGALAKILSAPITEIATGYYGSDSPDGVEEGVSKFRDAIAKSNIEGYIDAAAGVVHEELEKEGVKGKAAVLVIGWASLEAHMAFRKTSVFEENIGLLKEGVQKIEMHHVTFLNYKS